VRARAVQTEEHSQVGVQAGENWVLQPTETNYKSQNLLLLGHVSVHWDENMSEPAIDLERWQSFLEERALDLLCMFVHIEDDEICPQDVTIASGLMLRRLPGTVNGVAFVRMGVFVVFDCSFMTFPYRTWGPSRKSLIEDIDIDDAAYLGVIHTVTVIYCSEDEQIIKYNKATRLSLGV
jgi:hypothetical protein